MKNWTMCAAMAFAILLAMSFAGGASARQGDGEPPRADAFDSYSNFLACTGNPYALCYYSGPAEGQPAKDGGRSAPLPCVPNEDNSAECTCYAVTSGVYENDHRLNVYNFVEIGSILNPEVRAATIEECEPDGSNCLNMTHLLSRMCEDAGPGIAMPDYCRMASMCAELGDVQTGAGPTLYPNRPDVALISTFSFAYSDVHFLGSTDCTDHPAR